jgi:hypothetical protein
MEIQSCADNLIENFGRQAGSRVPYEVFFTVVKVILNKMLLPACRNSRLVKLSANDCKSDSYKLFSCSTRAGSRSSMSKSQSDRKSSTKWYVLSAPEFIDS